MGRLFAALYDLGMWLAGKQLESRRRRVVEGVSGRTLELGIGTAQNARFYPRGAEIIGVDPDPAMLDRAGRRIREAPADLHLVAAAGEALPFRDGSFDDVVVTLALCSVESLDRTLEEARRVLKPGGRLRFFEHVRSESRGWARVQDAVTPAWRVIATG